MSDMGLQADKPNQNKQVRLLQINLNHSFQTTEQLKIYPAIIKPDITIVQELYYLKNEIIGFPISNIIIAHYKKPRTAVILHSKKFDIPIHTFSRELIAVKISNSVQEFLIINVYAPPKDNISY